MIVLDTNVVSELMRPAPNDAVVDWVDSQLADDLFLTAVTVAELLYGIGRLPAGRRRMNLADRFEAMIDTDFDHRVAAFDEVAAEHYADIVIERERAGRPVAMADAQIAAICRSHDALLATRNIADFDEVGVRLLDPWTAAPS